MTKEDKIQNRDYAESPDFAKWDDLDDYDEDSYGSERRSGERALVALKPVIQLDWLINDFDGQTSSVYEAIMIAAHRARQIGRRQKQEIENFNASLEAVEIVNAEEEENDEPGVDHFHHSKPTVQALDELKKQKFTFYYPETTGSDRSKKK